MSYELRPLTLAEMLDAAFRLVQTEWRTLIGLSLIIQIPLVFLALAVPWMFDPMAQPFQPGKEMTDEVLREIMTAVGGMGLVYVILYPFIAASVTASVGQFYLGRSFDLGQAARAGARSLLRLVAAYFVWAIGYFGVVMGVGTLAFLTVGGGGAVFGEWFEAAGTLGTVVAVVLAVGVGAVAFYWILFATMVSSLLPSVVVLESRGIFASVARAFSLGSTAKGRVIGVVFTTGLIVGFPVFGAQMLIGMIPVVGLLTWALFQAVGFAFSTSVMVVLYFDLRCRAENYDLELLAEQVEAGRGLGHG
jgi:hypothetical protein